MQSQKHAFQYQGSCTTYFIWRRKYVYDDTAEPARPLNIEHYDAKKIRFTLSNNFTFNAFDRIKVWG